MPLKLVMASNLPPPPGGPTPEGMAAGAGVDFVRRHCETESEIIDLARDADGLIVSGRQQATRAVIEKLNKCRVISQTGIGYENVDVKAATEHGICVTNVPDYCLEEVADHAMTLLLALARKLLLLNSESRDASHWGFAYMFQHWSKIPRLRGQTLGLVGFGNIPRTLVPKAKGFGLRIIAYDPYVTADVAEKYGVTMVELEQLLRESDYVSLHAPVTPQTRHLLGSEQFKKMKPTAYVLNTARGPLVDEKALYEALIRGQIAGAALDVTDPEPPKPDNPLFKLDNVLLTGHSAHASAAAYAELCRRYVDNALAVLRGEFPQNLVNPEVKEKFKARWGNP